MPDETLPPSSNPHRHLSGLRPDALMAHAMGRAGPAPEARPVAIPELPGIVIGSVLGRGGMGTVYLGRQLSLDRAVAVKVLAAEVADDPLFLERLEREARIMANLRHPNIVTVYDFQPLPEGGAAIIMEYVEGGSLRDLLRKNVRGLPLEQTARLVWNVASALKVAHAAGVIHRDIKPENALLSDHGTVRVTDFGLAAPLHEKRTQLTLTGAAVGTVDYMAPEQLKGGPQDARVDVYALGVLAYELLTGQTPRGNFDPPHRLRKQLSRKVSAVIMRALRPDPGERHHSAEDFALALQAESRRGIIPLEDIVAPLFFVSVLGAAVYGVITWVEHSQRNRSEAAAPAFKLAEASSVPASADAAAPVADAEATRLLAPSSAVVFGPWTDAIAGVHIHNDNYGGDWTNEDGVLTSNNAICVMALERDIDMPPSYDVRMRFTRLGGEHSVALFFRAANGTIGSAELDAWAEALAGVQLIGSDSLQRGYGFRFPIENGRSYEVLVEVRPERVRMTVDGEFKKEFDITNKVLHPPQPWQWDPFTRPAVLAVGSYESPTRFEKVEWREVKEGK